MNAYGKQFAIKRCQLSSSTVGRCNSHVATLEIRFFILAFLPQVPLQHHVTMRLLDYPCYCVHRRLFVCSLAG